MTDMTTFRDSLDINERNTTMFLPFNVLEYLIDS